MLFSRALLDGFIFSVLMGLMITIIELINPRLELHNYPLAIRNTVPPKTEEEQKKFRTLAVPMLSILLIYLVGTIVQAYSAWETGYLIILMHSFTVIMFWNIFDLLVMDWLIFCTITPKYLIIPGTEGDTAYKDYNYHINGSLGKGLIFAAIAAIAISFIVFIILRSWIW